MANGRESQFLAIVRDAVTDHFVAHGLPLGQHYWRVVQFWSNLFSAGLVDELDRRTKQRESRHGNQIAELIVEEGRRGELLGQIGKQIARLPSFTGELPKQSEDAESQACENILEQLGPLVTCTPPAANPEFLKATITGALNNVVFHARDRLWYQRKVEQEEAKILLAVDPTSAEPDHEHPRGIDSLIPPDEPLHRSEKQLETKLLVEQAIGHLEDDEKKIVMLVEVEGYTQNKVGRELGISQPTVSRLLNSGLEKLRKRLS
jgi:RNA polymerase sigma factor (sigma-70 family)